MGRSLRARSSRWERPSDSTRWRKESSTSPRSRLRALGCVAGQGFLFAKAGSLEELSTSPFVARRNLLWTAHAAREELSATGRFKALRALARRAAGAA